VLNNAGPRYRITRVIKQGGQGAVYEARGEDDKIYAVKEMLDNYSDPAERAGAIERFEAEARLLQRLVHPRIPRVYAYFEDENRFYLAMDFVRGEDLEDIVDRQGPLPEQQVLEWAAQISDVLSYLHANGLIYRDMKPSNAMLETSGGIKVVDFGIAKVLQQTRQGTSIGTPGYAPPEQYQGLASVESDVFALAATLHHLLTGRDPTKQPPFNFPPARSLNPSVSQRTSDVLGRALQMRPEERYHSMEAFRAALLDAPATPAPPPVSKAPTPATKAPTPAPAPAPPVTKPPTPAPPATKAPAPAPAPNPTVRRSGWRGCIVTLLLLLIAAGAGAYYLAPELVGSYIPALERGPTATPQTFVEQVFETELTIVPPDASPAGLRRAFADAFVQLTVDRFGPGTQVRRDSIEYVAEPDYVSDTVQGPVYRATLRGTILVPQP
jgi:eukaryotic-like serine/threonine-protein kinase